MASVSHCQLPLTGKITLDDVNVLYQYAQCQYNSGNYGAAADLLYHFRILVCVSVNRANDSLRMPI